jgi:hypothetical protein
MLRPREPSPAQGRQGLIVLRDGPTIRKMLSGDLRPVDMGDVRWPMDLAALARDRGAPWIVVLQVGVLETLMDRLASKSQRGQDALDQILLAWGIARELVAEGQATVWPARMMSVPVPTRRMVLGALGLVCPARQSVVLAAWSETGGLWTSLVMRRGDEGVEALVGPIAIRERMARSLRGAEATHADLIAAVEKEVGSVAVGISATVAVWGQLTEQTGVGGWTRAVARGAMRLEPFPRTLAVPLAVDATRMAFGVARTALGRLLTAGRTAEGVESTGAKGAGALADLMEALGVVQGLMRLQRRQR